MHSSASMFRNSTTDPKTDGVTRVSVTTHNTRDRKEREEKKSPSLFVNNITNKSKHKDDVDNNNDDVDLQHQQQQRSKHTNQHNEKPYIVLPVSSSSTALYRTKNKTISGNSIANARGYYRVETDRHSALRFLNKREKKKKIHRQRKNIRSYRQYTQHNESIIPTESECSVKKFTHTYDSSAMCVDTDESLGRYSDTSDNILYHDSSNMRDHCNREEIVETSKRNTPTYAKITTTTTTTTKQDVGDDCLKSNVDYQQDSHPRDPLNSNNFVFGGAIGREILKPFAANYLKYQQQHQQQQQQHHHHDDTSTIDHSNLDSIHLQSGSDDSISINYLSIWYGIMATFIKQVWKTILEAIIHRKRIGKRSGNNIIPEIDEIVSIFNHYASGAQYDTHQLLYRLDDILRQSFNIQNFGTELMSRGLWVDCGQDFDSEDTIYQSKFNDPFQRELQNYCSRIMNMTQSHLLRDQVQELKFNIVLGIIIETQLELCDEIQSCYNGATASNREQLLHQEDTCRLCNIIGAYSDDVVSSMATHAEIPNDTIQPIDMNALLPISNETMRIILVASDTIYKYQSFIQTIRNWEEYPSMYFGDESSSSSSKSSGHIVDTNNTSTIMTGDQEMSISPEYYNSRSRHVDHSSEEYSVIQSPKIKTP